MDCITEVFRDNFKQEEEKLLLALYRYKTVALDTEFPGYIEQTPRLADDNQRYRDLKSNVERTKLIQAGFTVFDPATSTLAGVWQFNFAGFSPNIHDHSPASIQMLERAGVDFVRNSRKGVRMTQFTRLLKRIRDSPVQIQWVTFHGLYDVAYLMAALSGVWRLPFDVFGFCEAAAASLFRGGVFDLKAMSGKDNDWMGLERLAATLGAARESGGVHQAGSDSLLTADVFIKLVRMLQGCNVSFLTFKGFMYGLGVAILPVTFRCSYSMLNVS